MGFPVRWVMVLAAFVAASSEAQQKPGSDPGISFYKAACGTGGAMGDALACYRLAELYWDGRGVAQDRMQAALLYQKACERSDREPRACLRLGELYERGEVAPKTPSRALVLYQLGCDAGDPEACSRITSLKASLQDTAPKASVPASHQEAPAQQVQPSPPPSSVDPDSEEAVEADIAKMNEEMEAAKKKATSQASRDKLERMRQIYEIMRREGAKAARLERELKAGNRKLEELRKKAEENTAAMKRNQEEREALDKMLKKYEPYQNSGSGSAKSP